MPKQIPTLHDRRDFPAWQKAIQKSLTPFEWNTVTWSEGGPPVNASYGLLWQKARAQAYNTIIQSIPDIILLGLGAHDEVDSMKEFYSTAQEGYPVDGVPGGCPKELFRNICKYFDPTRGMIADQIRCIANSDPAKFEEVDEYVARTWLSKVCVDLCPMEDNPVLTILLCDAIEDSHPAVFAELASVDYKRTFSQVLYAMAKAFAHVFEEREPRPAGRKRDADDTAREAKRAKTEPGEEASDATVTSETVESSG